MNEPVVAWHFLRNDLKLRYQDGRTVRRGEILRAPGRPGLCANGMHGSLRAIDALEYAPGTVVCRTVHHGEVVFGDDKLVSKSREVVWMADATCVIVGFAKWCAARAAAYADAAARAAYADAAARAADAAYADAAYADAAARAAACAAARAAYAAYADAAYADAAYADAAARAAAYAARAAARAARAAFEREAQNDELTRLLCELGQRNPLWPT